MQKTTISVLAVLLLMMMTLSTSLEEMPVDDSENSNLTSARNDSDNGTAEMTKEDCEEQGGIWTAATDDDAEGEYYCDVNDVTEVEDEPEVEGEPEGCGYSAAGEGVMLCKAGEWTAIEENRTTSVEIGCDEEPTEEQLNESNLADLLNKHGEILIQDGNDTYYMEKSVLSPTHTNAKGKKYFLNIQMDSGNENGSDGINNIWIGDTFPKTSDNGSGGWIFEWQGEPSVLSISMNENGTVLSVLSPTHTNAKGKKYFLNIQMDSGNENGSDGINNIWIGDTFPKTSDNLSRGGHVGWTLAHEEVRGSDGINIWIGDTFPKTSDDGSGENYPYIREYSPNLSDLSISMNENGTVTNANVIRWTNSTGSCGCWQIGYCGAASDNADSALDDYVEDEPSSREVLVAAGGVEVTTRDAAVAGIAATVTAILSTIIGGILRPKRDDSGGVLGEAKNNDPVPGIDIIVECCTKCRNDFSDCTCPVGAQDHNTTRSNRHT